jgi:hypothetical protein
LAAEAESKSAPFENNQELNSSETKKMDLMHQYLQPNHHA